MLKTRTSGRQTVGPILRGGANGKVRTDGRTVGLDSRPDSVRRGTTSSVGGAACEATNCSTSTAASRTRSCRVTRFPRRHRVGTLPRGSSSSWPGFRRRSVRVRHSGSVRSVIVQVFIAGGQGRETACQERPLIVLDPVGIAWIPHRAVFGASMRPICRSTSRRSTRPLSPVRSPPAKSAAIFLRPRLRNRRGFGYTLSLRKAFRLGTRNRANPCIPSGRPSRYRTPNKHG